VAGDAVFDVGVEEIVAVLGLQDLSTGYQVAH
jgi:hypothetical protein